MMTTLWGCPTPIVILANRARCGRTCGPCTAFLQLKSRDSSALTHMDLLGLNGRSTSDSISRIAIAASSDLRALDYLLANFRG